MYIPLFKQNQWGREGGGVDEKLNDASDPPRKLKKEYMKIGGILYPP